MIAARDGNATCAATSLVASINHHMRAAKEDRSCGKDTNTALRDGQQSTERRPTPLIAAWLYSKIPISHQVFRLDRFRAGLVSELAGDSGSGTSEATVDAGATVSGFEAILPLPLFAEIGRAHV